MGRQSTSADVWGKLFHPKHPPLRGFQAVVDAGLESAFGLSNIAPTAVWKPRSDEWLA
jgi:hypothetical protein